MKRPPPLPKGRDVKVAYFDIESTDLKADFGRLLCVSVLTHEGDMVTLRQDEYVADGRATDMADDGALARDARDLLEAHHCIAGWFIKGFDISFLNTRLVAGGHRQMKPRLCYDPRWYYSGWRGLSPRNARLKTVSEFFGYEPKPDVPAEVWVKARGGNRAAMDEVCDRCEADVRISKEIGERTFEEGLVRNLQSYP